MRTIIIHFGSFHLNVYLRCTWKLTAAIMTMTIREIGRCWEDVRKQRRGPVSLGINLARGSTNRLSPPISCLHRDSHLYCQVAAAAAPEKKEDSSKRRIGTPLTQNAMQQDMFCEGGGVLATSEAFTRVNLLWDDGIAALSTDSICKI